MRTTSDNTVSCRFFAPLERALAGSANRRRCPEFPDEEFLESGVGRVIADVQSGRDWVQRLHMWMNARLTVSNFFKSLASTRRLALLEEVSERVRLELDRGDRHYASDPLAEHRELDGFALYASDGHCEQPAAHGKRFGRKLLVPQGFFSLNLRTHSMALLDIAKPLREREHDMHLLKRLGATKLRMAEPKGRKVIHVYDPAGIDYLQWMKWKAKGVYLISTEKANSKAVVMGMNSWDQSDSRNTGVLADQIIGVFAGVMMRRVLYRDPATDRRYSFITSEMNLPPGLIAFLYKLRWDIEKVFDEKKNKLLEKKAWAAGDTARTQQARFVCLAHNLMVLLERCLEREGIRDEKVQAKRRRRTQEMIRDSLQLGNRPNPMVLKCSRMTQRSLQFIRWLRHYLFDRSPWNDALASLRPLMEAYLT